MVATYRALVGAMAVRSERFGYGFLGDLAGLAGLAGFAMVAGAPGLALFFAAVSWTGCGADAVSVSAAVEEAAGKSRATVAI